MLRRVATTTKALKRSTSQLSREGAKGLSMLDLSQQEGTCNGMSLQELALAACIDEVSAFIKDTKVIDLCCTLMCG